MEQLQLYQIIILIISVSMIFAGLSKYFKKEASQSILKLSIRIVVWGGMGLIAVFPDLSDKVAELTGIQDNINAVIMSGFLLVFLLIFKILSVIERIEQEVSALTRQDALKPLLNKHQNKAISPAMRYADATPAISQKKSNVTTTLDK